MSQINVTIDRLVLRGVDPGDSKAVAAALQGELAKVLSDPATRAAWAHSRQTPVVRLGRLPLDKGAAGGRKFGAGVARAIGRNLSS